MVARIAPRELLGVPYRRAAMQTRPRALVLAVVALALVAVAVAACGAEAVIPTAAGPLVTVELRGGECPAGACGWTVYLERDGRVHEAAKPPNDLGTVPAAQVAAIDSAIKLTDFAGLRSRPFTGQCPTAFDGQEIVYTFATASGPERIASCEVDIDEGLPLFVAVATALGPWVPLPVT
jgi:hypothetical protein